MKVEDLIFDMQNAKFKEIDFILKTKKLKPIFTSTECKANNEFICMLDSGAAIPVWCSGVPALLDTFPTAVLKPDLKSILSGFGTSFEVVDVYNVPKVELCNGSHSIIFENFYLPVTDRKNFGADLIIPSFMFKNSNILLSQLESLGNQKRLFIQYQVGHYRTHYTVRYLSMQEVTRLNKLCEKQDITIDTKILGGAGEFYKVLVQDDLKLLLARFQQPRQP